MYKVPPKKIEYGFGYVIVRPPYTPYSIYLRGTIFRHPVDMTEVDAHPNMPFRLSI